MTQETSPSSLQPRSSSSSPLFLSSQEMTSHNSTTSLPTASRRTAHVANGTITSPTCILEHPATAMFDDHDLGMPSFSFDLPRSDNGHYQLRTQETRAGNCDHSNTNNGDNSRGVFVLRPRFAPVSPPSLTSTPVVTISRRSQYKTDGLIRDQDLSHHHYHHLQDHEEDWTAKLSKPLPSSVYLPCL